MKILRKAMPLLLATVLMLTLLSSCSGGNSNYTKEDFDAFFGKLVALEQALTIMQWDVETGGAPSGAMEARGKTMAILEAEWFDMGVSDEMRAYFKFVEAAEKRGEADEAMLATYRECKSNYDKLMCIPADEYKAFSELTSTALQKWSEAREKSDFSIFAPYLQGIMDYRRKVVDYRAKAGMTYAHPYDAMLDDFEPGMTVEQLDAFFDELRAEIVPLLKGITESPQANSALSADILSRRVPRSVLENVSALLMDTVGYDLERGAIAESAHPFSTSIGQTDCRITTAYKEAQPFSSFYSVLHECGHAIYEQNISGELEGTVLDSGASMAIHESQSRFLENIVGRSYEFWEGIYEDFLSVTEGYFDDVSAREL